MELNTNLITYKMAGGTKNKLLIGIAIGLVGFALAFVTDAVAGWKTFIAMTFALTSLAVAGPFITALMYVSGTRWGIVVRRVPEAFGNALPVAFVLLLVVFAGLLTGSLHHVYEWSHAEVVAGDRILQHKSAWLDAGFMVARLAVFVLIWIAFSRLFTSLSRKQDEDGDVGHTVRISRWGAPFIVIFALTYSVLGFDLLMSAAPHWFSTMWGVYCFAGLAVTAFAAMILYVNFLKKQGLYGSYLNENHIHDLGKFTWGFTIFYAYIAFSQFMLIWYSNIPEETGWYETHTSTPAGFILMLLVVIFRFVLPFFMLLNRPSKRNISYLSKVAWIVVIGQLLDIGWVLFFSGEHEYFPDHHGLGSGLAILGAYVLASIGTISLVSFFVLKGLEKARLIPVKDPMLEESLHWHQ